jgi:DNA-binding HxlR family transcriptional regulator
MTEDQSDSFNTSRAEVFEALGHPTRMRILQALNDRALGFSELKRETGIESNGLLAFHLGKLTGLVKLNSESSYALTDEGREALRIIEASRKQPEVHPSQRPALHLPHPKAILAGLLVALIVLGSVAVYQQAQLQSLNAGKTAVSSAQNVLVYGTVGVNQTWPSGVQGSFQVTQITFTSDKGQVYSSYPNAAGQYWVSLPNGETYSLSVSYQGSGECSQSCASVYNFSQGLTGIFSIETATSVPEHATSCAPSGCPDVQVRFVATGVVRFQEQGDSISIAGTCGTPPLELVPGSSTIDYNPSC